MQSTHRFTVPAPLEDAQNAFRRPDVIATCVPGATVMTADRNEVRGALKIKMGPLPLAYDGSASFREGDPATPQMLIEVNGADRRGHGTILGTITASFADGGTATEVELASDLSLTGRVAQFGDGVIKDAGGKLLEQFATRLSARIAEGIEPPPPVETAPDVGEAEGDDDPTVIIERERAEQERERAERERAEQERERAERDRAEQERVRAERAQRERAERVREERAAFVPVSPREADHAEPSPAFAPAAQAPREPYVYRPPTNPKEPDIAVMKRVAPRLIKRAGPPLLIAALIAFVIMRTRRRRR
jgi:carbon monoxide dehydrogenase subunit G